MTTAEADYVEAPTLVWWDIENCGVPKGYNPQAIRTNVVSALLNMNYRGPVTISAYGDTNLIPITVQHALYSTAIKLNHVPAGVKDASDKKILVDMLLWAVDNSAPANFMLISSDRDFSIALHELRMRRYNILLAHTPQVSTPLVLAAKTVWLWTSLASGGPPLSSTEESSQLVSNKEVSKHPVSEQAQSSKPTDSSSNIGDMKDNKTSEKFVPKGLGLETRRSKLENCSGTTGEPPRLVNELCHVSNKEASKHPVSAQAQPNKPTDSSLDDGDMKDIKTSVNNFSRGSPQETKRNMHQKGRGGTSDSVTASRICNVVECDISQAPISDNSIAPASVSAKPIQEVVLLEPVVCNVGKISCSNNDEYKNQIFGKRHRNNLELQSGKSKIISVGTVEPSKKVLEKNKAIEGGAKANTDLGCLMCNVVCLSQSDFDSHLGGKKHAAKQNQSEALIDSTKLEEKGVGEKDQPRETIVNPQLQSQNAQENSKSSENHVLTVTQSEVIIVASNEPQSIVSNKPMKERYTPKNLKAKLLITFGPSLWGK